MLVFDGENFAINLQNRRPSNSRKNTNLARFNVVLAIAATPDRESFLKML